jgi:hypothetical protein
MHQIFASLNKINPVEIFLLFKKHASFFIEMRRYHQSYEKTDTEQQLLLLLQITFAEAQHSAVHNPVSNAAALCH